jgi:hypothetical protein
VDALERRHVDEPGAVAADQQRFALTNPVDPGKLPGDLAQQALFGAVGGRGLENGDREALPLIGL